MISQEQRLLIEKEGENLKFNAEKLLNDKYRVIVKISVLRKNENVSDKDLTGYIIKTVCWHQGVVEKDVLSCSRRKQLVKARQIIVFLARKHTELSFLKIGVQLGNRHHSTILFSLKRINDYLSFEKDLVKEVEYLDNKINNFVTNENL